MKMNILYDTELLGFAQIEPAARTGIYRVVKKIAELLATSSEVNLYLNTNHQHRQAAEEYICQNHILSKSETTYSYMSGNLFADTVKYLYEQKENATQVKNLYTRNPERIPFSAWEKILKATYNVAEASYKAYQNKKAREVNDCDIFHSPFFPIPEFIKQRKKMKKITTIYDLIPILFPDFFEKGTVDIVIKSIQSIEQEDFALAISQSTKDDLCNYRPSLDPNRVFVTRLAADPDIFYPCPEQSLIRQTKEKYGMPPDAQYFLSLCTLEPRKNIDHVIRCFVELINQENLPDVQLVLVGVKGWKFDKIFNTIQDNRHVRDRIIVTGFADDEDLSALYSGSLGFVYMSLYEGFGLPPLEAMQCGVPVVTSNTSSLPEVVGTAGVLLDPRDADGLCQAMLDLYRDAGLRRRMGQGSLAQAARFSWDKCVRQTTEAYRKTLG